MFLLCCLEGLIFHDYIWLSLACLERGFIFSKISFVYSYYRITWPQFPDLTNLVISAFLLYPWPLPGQQEGAEKGLLSSPAGRPGSFTEPSVVLSGAPGQPPDGGTNEPAPSGPSTMVCCAACRGDQRAHPSGLRHWEHTANGCEPTVATTVGRHRGDAGLWWGR